MNNVQTFLVGGAVRDILLGFEPKDRDYVVVGSTAEQMLAEGFSQDRIERVGHLKLGFDIRAHKIADEATGEVFVKRVEVKGRLRGQPVRLTTNEWYKAQQLAETYWLYVVWGPLGDSPELVRIHNPVAKLDHAKREIVAARFYEISADAVQQAAMRNE